MKKKILILSVGDNHGAYEAAYRMSKLLIEADYEVAMIVREKTKSDSFIISVPPAKTKTIVERGLRRVFPKSRDSVVTNPDYYFLNKNENEQFISDELILSILPFTPDLIIAGLISGFLNTSNLAALSTKTKAKVYMLTVDMAPLTGGCHFSWGCKGYTNDCSNCPAIIDEANKNRAYENLLLKKSNISKHGIKVLAGSGWTYDQAKESALFKNQEVIYNTNGITDTRLFNSKHRKYAKALFSIPVDSKIIFTGSWFTHDKRKGLSYFVDALSILWDTIDERTKSSTYILIAGEHTAGNDIIDRIPFQKHLIDYIKDYRLLSLAYQASDIFVCSSIEDSGPLMVSEALACGTPVVGFEMGVVSNLVVNGYNGYKAELKNSVDMAKGLHTILTLSDEEFAVYSQNSINQIEEFSSHKIFVDIVDRILLD